MTKPDHTRTLIPIVGVVIGMAAMAWAAVPLYDWFCRVTGYGGTTQAAAYASDTILDQTVTVRFDASTARDMPWTFKPAKPTMEIRIGETGLAFYEASNPTDRPGYLERHAAGYGRIFRQNRLLLHYRANAATR